MSLKARNFMLFMFVVLFLVLTIIVSLYASGYRFNLSWPLRYNKILQKTGMLAISTTPRGATIYLDGRAQRGQTLKFWGDDYLTTPNKLKGLLPGEYTLRLELAGYWPLEKKFRIEPGQTTFAEDLNLFNSSQPLLIASSSDGHLQLSPNRRYLYLGDGKRVVDLKTGTEKALPFDITAESQWLANGKLFGAGCLFDPEKGTAIDYRQVIGAEAADWLYEEAGGNVYYKNKDTLNRLAADGKTNALLLNGNYLSYEPRGKHLFVVVTEKNKIFLKDYSIESQKFNQQLELPAIGHYRFILDNQAVLSLYDDQNKTLYLIDPDKFEASSDPLRNVVSWQWLNDGQLLYNNRWEVYLFDLSSGRSSLLTRVSEEITHILWQSNNGYLVFLTPKSLQAFDWRAGTMTTILKAEKISWSVLDDKNSLLYLNAQIDGREGIYKLLLQ